VSGWVAIGEMVSDEAAGNSGCCSTDSVRGFAVSGAVARPNNSGAGDGRIGLGVAGGGFTPYRCVPMRIDGLLRGSDSWPAAAPVGVGSCGSFVEDDSETEDGAESARSGWLLIETA